MAQRVKNTPATQETQETWVQSLDQEDPREEEMTIVSSILAWRIPRTEEPGGLQSMGSQRVRHDRASDRVLHTREGSAMTVTGNSSRNMNVLQGREGRWPHAAGGAWHCGRPRKDE